jgi:hypothetical protein
MHYRGIDRAFDARADKKNMFLEPVATMFRLLTLPPIATSQHL